MKPSPRPRQNRSPQKAPRRTARKAISLPSDEVLQTFEQSMLKTAQAFLDLRDRFVAVRSAKRHYQDLQAQLPTLPEAELKAAQQQIEDLSFTLESQLVTEQDLLERLWQIFRFGGLGLVLGWFLRGWLT